MSGAQHVPPGELKTDEALVRRLLTQQFPVWANLLIARVSANSTDNDIYRLGPDMVVRLPRRASAELPIAKECEWLPHLAPHLPFPISLPIGQGTADDRYPYCWSVMRWVDGETPPLQVNDLAFARDVGALVKSLRAIDSSGGPQPGAHNFWRAVPLRVRDSGMRERFNQLSDFSGIRSIISEWDYALTLPEWDQKPVWTHGDLQRGNLLMLGGSLSGVIDWSALAVGDPAGDLALAWSLLGADARAAYREVLDVDDATWRRGRAWALIEGVLAFSYYRGKNEVIAEAGERVIATVLSHSA